MAIDVCATEKTPITPPVWPKPGGGGATYTAGNGISIDAQNVINALRNPDNTYTKEEVDNLISAIQDFDVVIVDELPATGEAKTIYFVPKQGESGYDEWMYIDGSWEQVGDTTIDLSDYYTKSQTDALLDEKADATSVYTKTETDTLLAAKADATSVYTKTETDALLDEKADADTVYTKTETDALLADKADASSVYTKSETDALLDTKQDVLDKAGILAILGYEETELTLTDVNNNTVTKTILVKVEV